MIKTQTERPVWQRLMGFSLLIAIVASLFGSMSAFADEDETTMSFYKATSNLSALMSNALSPGEKGEKIEGKWAEITSNAGNAGDMLGYVDPKFSFSLDWLASKATGSSSALDYTFLSKATTEGGTDLSGLLGYAQYGATLNMLGFSGTGGGMMGSLISFIGGGLMLLAFMFAYMVDWLFVAIIKALIFLNPFRLFANLTGIGSQQQVGMYGDVANADSVMGGIRNFINDWYGFLINMSWTVVVPVFIAVLLFSLMLSQKAKKNKGGKIKALAIRIAYIAIGIPVLGSLYTASLNSMEDTLTADGGGGAQNIVLSTYVDFQAWVMNDKPLGLSIIIDAKWDADSGTVSVSDTDQEFGIRDIAYDINRSTGKYNLGSNEDKLGADQDWTNSAMAGMADENGTKVSTSTAWGSITNMLWRYMSGEKVLASDYETYWKGSLSGTGQGEDPGEATPGEDDNNTKGLLGQFDEIREAKKLKDISENKGIRVEDATKQLLFANGQPITATQNGGSVSFTGEGGLSPLAMYNFLNTDFKNNSLTVYSSEQASSFSARDNLTAVNQVGTGFMGFMYWFNGFAILLAYAVIGIFYALGMLFGNVKKSVSMISAVPFATLGAIGGIAKVVIYTVAMIVEIIATLFMYQIVGKFLLGVNALVERPLYGIVNGTGIAGSIITVIGILISTIIVLVFTGVALKIRKSVLKAINEATTKFVNTFMETGINTPGGGGALAAAGKGAMAGAGMAALSNRGLRSSGDGGNPKGPGALSGSISGDGSSSATSGLSGIAGAIGGGDEPGQIGPGSDGGSDGGPDTPLPGGGSGGGLSTELMGITGGGGNSSEGEAGSENTDTMGQLTGDIDSAAATTEGANAEDSSKSNNALSLDGSDRDIAEKVKEQNGLTPRGLKASTDDGADVGVTAQTDQKGEASNRKDVQAGKAASAAAKGASVGGPTGAVTAVGASLAKDKVKNLSAGAKAGNAGGERRSVVQGAAAGAAIGALQATPAAPVVNGVIAGKAIVDNADAISSTVSKAAKTLSGNGGGNTPSASLPSYQQQSTPTPPMRGGSRRTEISRVQQMPVDVAKNISTGKPKTPKVTVPEVNPQRTVRRGNN